MVYFGRGHLSWVLVGALQMRLAEPLGATPRPAVSRAASARGSTAMQCKVSHETSTLTTGHCMFHVKPAQAPAGIALSLSRPRFFAERKSHKSASSSRRIDKSWVPADTPSRPSGNYESALWGSARCLAGGERHGETADSGRRYRILTPLNAGDSFDVVAASAHGLWAARALIPLIPVCSTDQREMTGAAHQETAHKAGCRRQLTA